MFLSQVYSLNTSDYKYEVIDLDDISIFKVENDTGNGECVSYKVFSGVYVIYNNFDMKEYFNKFKVDKNTCCIDYCKDGRVECIYNDNHLYLNQGDIQLNVRSHYGKYFEFQTGIYKGVTIIFYLEKLNKNLKELLSNFNIDFNKIKDKLLNDNKTFVISENADLNNIFNDLYKVDKTIMNSYLKIKVIELLLLLSNLDIEKDINYKKYFSKQQIKKIKSILKYMIDNIDKHITLKELSEEFNYPLTSMKECFKEVYGDSIYNYIKLYKINRACILLKTGNETISTIANSIGYNNPSKFSAAFKSIHGITPLEYRKINSKL